MSAAAARKGQEAKRGKEGLRTRLATLPDFGRARQKPWTNALRELHSLADSMNK